MTDLLNCAREARRLAHAMALSAAQERDADKLLRESRARLIESAGRVLAQTIEDPERSLARASDAIATADAPVGHDATPPDDQLWQLTCEMTTLSVEDGHRNSIDEATAALQEASCVFAESGTDVAARLRVLRELQGVAPARILPRHNGPYVATNLETLTNWLGEQVVVPPLVALCRCGGSAMKPFCDGSHARNQFKDEKDPKRVADRQDTYVGQQLTVLDNRGTCAHSGFCSDRLSSVFHAGQEPFVTPSGARMDEIVRAVRACPSGALSFAVDEREARDQVDAVRPPAVEISKDGPYRVTGGIPLVDQEGAPVARNAGASLEHYSLCRCGQSQNKPFCSGMLLPANISAARRGVLLRGRQATPLWIRVPMQVLFAAWAWMVR